MELFPTFLKLAGREAVLVGGGTVASAKLPALVAAGAAVTVVAPRIARAIRRTPGVRLAARRFRPSDLDRAWFVVAAAPAAVNRRVAAAARRRRVFVNVVDDPRHATAYAGAIVRKGGVTFVISTDGRAPGLSALLRQALEVVLPDDLDAWLRAAGRARRRWIGRRVPMQDRKPLLLDVLNGLYRERSMRSG